MKTLPFVFIALLLSLTRTITAAQTTEIKIPPYKDKYSDYVRKLEQGQVDIDYVDFRNSFLESKQFSAKDTMYDHLKKKVLEAARAKDFQAVLQLTKAMLSIDYTSMFAHKYLRQTYKALGDSAHASQYHDIEFGLLRSITQTSDGKTCATGWHVTQIEEEYFILGMMGATLRQQTLTSNERNRCDKMEVTKDDGSPATYYFEINMLLASESKLFKD